MAFSPWYKEMAVYQIWPRSYTNGNGHANGERRGVLTTPQSMQPQSRPQEGK